MEKILLITDAANDLTPESVAGKPVAIVPATVCYGGKSYKEFFDLDPKAFWDTLETSGEIPVTQQATPLDFLDCYREAVRQGYTHAVVCVVSSTGSGVIASAAIAREMLAEEPAPAPGLVVEIVDSLGYSMMYGHIILEAVKLVERGASFSEVINDMRDRVSRAEALFMVYSLKHIRKSGRIGGMSAFVGEAMGLRPILRCVDGVITPIEKVRGEKRLVPRMIELIWRHCDDPSSQIFYLVTSKLPPGEAERAEEEIRRIFRPIDVIHMPIGPSVAANTGPHCMGVIYYGVKRN